jgi:hypothetical protein
MLWKRSIALQARSTLSSRAALELFEKRVEPAIARGEHALGVWQGLRTS